jgi:hypothetical protein
VKLAGACVCVALVAALAGCGGGTKNSSKPAAPLTLGQRLLTARDLPGLAPGGKDRFTDPDLAANQMKDVLFHPMQTAAHLRRAHFAVLLDQSFHSIAISRSHKMPPGGEIDSLVLRVGSPAAAGSLLSWMALQAQQPCPHVCDVRIQLFQPSGIPGGRGVERSRPKKTSSGAGFDLNIVGFADGPFLYLLTAGGQPGAFSRPATVRDALRLYERVHGAPAA